MLKMSPPPSHRRGRGRYAPNRQSDRAPFATLAPTSRAMASESNASCRAEATITDRDGQFLNNCTEFALLS